AAESYDEIGTFLDIILPRQMVPVHVAITLRSERIGDCSEWPALTHALNASQFLIPRLTTAEIREAIEAPLKVMGGKIEKALVDKIIDDVGKEDRLPLMQHALMRLWTLADERTRGAAAELRLEDYQRLGGGTRP